MLWLSAFQSAISPLCFLQIMCHDYIVVIKIMDIITGKTSSMESAGVYVLPVICPLFLFIFLPLDKPRPNTRGKSTS